MKYWKYATHVLDPLTRVQERAGGAQLDTERVNWKSKLW
jgi:hypothetical protein